MSKKTKDKYQVIIEAAIKVIAEHGYHNAQSHPSIRKRIAEPLRGYYRLIEEIVSEGMTKRLFRENLNVHPARQVIFGTMDEVATCWVMSPKPYSLSEQAPAVFDLLAHALGAGLNGKLLKNGLKNSCTFGQQSIL